MGIFKKYKNEARYITMVTDQGNGYYKWDGRLYRSDIVRSCIRPMARAMGKMTARHIRKSDGKTDVFPEPYIKFLLDEPNPYMTGQVMQEKVATQLALNNNAFILILRDSFGMPCGLYPIPAISAETVYDGDRLHLKFVFENGRQSVIAYDDIIHLRNDFYGNDLFGDSPAPALCDLMELVGTVDRGVIKAIRNSGVVRWLLRFTTPMRPEALKENVQQFVDNYLSVDSSTFGAAGVDSKADAIRIEPRDYVPNAAISGKITERLYAFFNTNEKIIKSTATEDEWNTYFEMVLEPEGMQWSGEYTRKLFSRRQRACGNEIVFEASNLSCASLTTKLALVAMVDRGALTPNEWRATMNLAPVEGGDVPLRRKDTGTVAEGGEKE